MRWMGWIVVALALLTAGWMTFDGVRALTVGDYVTSDTVPLGPWAKVVEMAGIEPHSTVMKSIFVGYGTLTLIFALCFALRLPWAWWGLTAMAILGLWYIPFGTATNVVSLVLLMMPSLRPAGR